MWSLIECFGKVQKYGISLKVIIKIRVNIMKEDSKLHLAWEAFSKSMLRWSEKIY